MQQIKVKGYIRKTKKGLVRVSSYVRATTKSTQPINHDNLMYEVFSWDGESSLHSVSRDWTSLDDKLGSAVLLSMSSDEGYDNMLSKKNTFSGKVLIKKADEFIGRHQDTPCKGLFSGVPFDLESFKKIKSGRYVSIGSGLPIYTTSKRNLAVGFSMYNSPKGSIPCLFEVVGGKSMGNSKHRSKHEDECEVCFKSTTKVRVVGDPILMNSGSEDEHYHIKVTFN